MRKDMPPIRDMSFSMIMPSFILKSVYAFIVADFTSGSNPQFSSVRPERDTRPGMCCISPELLPFAQRQAFHFVVYGGAKTLVSPRDMRYNTDIH